ncbi:MAG: hypothetical protein ACOCY3_02790 [Desulfosalsimonas sp.]
MKNSFDASVKTVFSAVLILVFIFLAPVYGSARDNETQAVTAFGSSASETDGSEAKRDAVSNGLLSAVQSATSGLLSEDEIRENFETILETLGTQRDDFIQDYRILSEFSGEKRHYVLIRATVSNRKLLEAFQQKEIRSSPEQMPSLALMVAEKNIDDLNLQYWWQSGYRGFSEPASVGAIKNVLEEKGFSVIDPSRGDVDAADVLEEVDAGSEPADHEAAIMAKRLGADLAVVGTAAAEATANRMGEDVRTFKAIVNLRVIDTETGEKLTSVREQAMTVGHDPEKGGKKALADAAFRAGGRLSDRIVSLWREDAESTERFTIHIKGDPLLAHLERLRNTLKQQTGVSELRTTEMTAKSAALSLEYQGTAQELADNILIRSFEDFGVNISDVSPEELTIELIPK